MFYKKVEISRSFLKFLTFFLIFAFFLSYCNGFGFRNRILGQGFNTNFDENVCVCVCVNWPADFFKVVTLRWQKKRINVNNNPKNIFKIENNDPKIVS